MGQSKSSQLVAAFGGGDSRAVVLRVDLPPLLMHRLGQAARTFFCRHRPTQKNYSPKAKFSSALSLLYQRMLALLLSRILFFQWDGLTLFIRGTSAMSTRGDGQTAYSKTCKRCGGCSELALTLSDARYYVYQCLDCKFVDWISQDAHDHKGGSGERSLRT